MNVCKISFKNCILAIWNQLTRKGTWRNIFVTHNAFGIFSEYSHISRRSGKPKISYPNKKVALRAAEAMGKKHGVHFSVYKCAWCDGWHIGKNAQNKIKSDILENSMSITPLSIHYEPIIPITFGWARSIKSMSEMLVDMNVEGKNKERNANQITEALLSFFMSCKEFRDTILSENETRIERNSLQMSNLHQDVADLYYNQLSAFCRDAIKLINAKPKAFMSFFVESVKKDSNMDEMVWRLTGGRASKMVKSLSVFNTNATHLANYV